MTKTRCGIIVTLLVSPLFGISARAAAIDFETAAEILRRECISCHGEKLQMSGLRLDRREDVMNVIEPGHSDDSLLIQRIVAKELGILMPPTFDLSKLPNKDLDALKAWIDAGAPWPEGTTLQKPRAAATDLAKVRMLRQHIRSGEFEEALNLLDAELKLIRIPNEYGSTALHAAALYGDATFVRAVLDRGADVNARDDDGVTPLMLAVHDVEKTGLLLESGADRSAVSKHGRSSLEIAASDSGNAAVLEQLLSAEFRPNDSQIDQALDQAVRVLDLEMVELLVARGGGTIKPKAIYYAGRSADPETLEAFLQLIPDAQRQAAKDAALAGAALEGALETMRMLLERGANPTPALVSAVYSEYSDLTDVKRLLDAGADPRQRSKIIIKMKTPLEMAKRHGDPDVIQLFQEVGRESSSDTEK